MRVLLIEDDVMLGDGMQDALRRAGYTVDWLQQGLSMLAALKCDEFAAAILDLNLPDIDGISLLKKVRRAGYNLPVLILTARDKLDDRVAGLDVGADDYMVKPFEFKELDARLRALIRRSQGQAQAILEYGDITINPQAQQVLYKGADVKLTPQEYKLLQELLSQPGRVFNRDQLQQRLYGWEDRGESNVVDVHIHHLRKKLYNNLIRNIRGVGYIVPSLDVQARAGSGSESDE
ncbi:MAG: response regulator [Enterovibrio sp.]